MTYEEVTLRLIQLMYVAHEERRIDVSLRNLTGDWLRRVEERFAGVNESLKASKRIWLRTLFYSNAACSFDTEIPYWRWHLGVRVLYLA